VALRKGSLVVNSSQGGGSKDTWVLREGGIGDDVLEEMRQKLNALGPRMGNRFTNEETAS